MKIIVAILSSTVDFFRIHKGARNLLVVVLIAFVALELICLPHSFTKAYAMKMFRQEIDKESTTASYGDADVIYITHYQDQMYVWDILRKCKPSFLEKKWNTAWLIVYLGNYNIGSVGAENRYFFLPATDGSMKHEFRLSKKDNEMLWDFLRNIPWLDGSAPLH